MRAVSLRPKIIVGRVSPSGNDEKAENKKRAWALFTKIGNHEEGELSKFQGLSTEVLLLHAQGSSDVLGFALKLAMKLAMKLDMKLAMGAAS